MSKACREENMNNIKEKLQQLESDSNSLDIPTKLKLEEQGYINLKKLDDNGSIVAAAYAGLTAKGKQVLSHED
tara:strand:- start:20484 stop:20702 length:219 start_codon:yes stop_codon:yes gene_type:complete